MTAARRPWSVLFAACLYLAVGTVGFAAHFSELAAKHPDALGIEITELLAVVSGAFLLRGHNWARWLALGWIAFHAVLSALHSLPEMAVHGLLCVAVAWLLFCSAADRYFHQLKMGAP
jgi:hypothetical protein